MNLVFVLARCGITFKFKIRSYSCSLSFFPSLLNRFYFISNFFSMVSSQFYNFFLSSLNVILTNGFILSSLSVILLQSSGAPRSCSICSISRLENNWRYFVMWFQFWLDVKNRSICSQWNCKIYLVVILYMYSYIILAILEIPAFFQWMHLRIIYWSDRFIFIYL